jgi:hypothetical protein
MRLHIRQHILKQTALVKTVKVVISGLPDYKFVWQIAPLTVDIDQIENGVHNLA